MSRENVEIVRSTYRRGDPSRFFELLDERVEVDTSAVRVLPDHPSPIKGKQAVLDFYRDYWGPWEDLVVEPIEITDLGEDRVLAVDRQRGRGRGSGAPFETHVAGIWTFEAGRVTRLQFFRTREEALDAVGFEE